jgi:hypothetical protein
MTEVIFDIYYIIMILISNCRFEQVSYILGLSITLVLTQDQCKLVDTSNCGVSTLIHLSNFVINSYGRHGSIFRHPQYKLLLQTHCSRPQPAAGVVRVALPICNSGFAMTSSDLPLKILLLP